jgi:hypothetical protein
MLLPFVFTCSLSSFSFANTRLIMQLLTWRTRTVQMSHDDLKEDEDDDMGDAFMADQVPMASVCVFF